MDKNYYDILQVNKNASPEIIEKAYKVLAKKYHPDLQTEENKKQSEEILKEINEAYEVLSNPEKKKEYDLFFAEQKQTVSQNYSTNSSKESSFSSESDNFPKEDFIFRQQQELLYQQRLQQEKQQQEHLRRKQELYYQQQLNQARQKAYYDAYIQDLKNRGYKIRYQKSFKDYIRIFVTIIVVFLVLFLLWKLPFVQNYFFDLYQKNELIHSLVDFLQN